MDVPPQPTATFTLRSAVASDFETLYEIDQLCYEPAIAYSRRELRHYLRFPGADCIVAESGDTMIGFCITAHHRGDGYIITMDVLAAYRRHGVGTGLLTEAESRLAAQNVSKIGLETATDNESAIAFWQKHGYRKSGIEKGYYPGGRDAYSMFKSLTLEEF